MEGPGPVGTGLWTLKEVRDVSVDPQGGPGRVGGSTGRSGTSRGTLEVVRGTLREVLETLLEV